MNSPRRILIRPFADGDPALIAGLLSAASPEYTRFFHPFAFETDAIGQLVFNAVQDQWFMLEIEQGGGFQPAGFYMLRGLDEGFADPMYGVFIAEHFAGRGLARLTLAHAEAQCRLNGWTNLLLKVDAENTRASRLYESFGFQFQRVDPKNGNRVLAKEILH